MKRLVVSFAAAAALVLPTTSALALSAAPAAAPALPAAGVFPPGWCDAGRTFFAPVFQAGMPILTAAKDFFGPGEEFMCGERKTVPQSVVAAGPAR